MVEPCDELDSGGGVLLIEERPELIAAVSACLFDRGYKTLTAQSLADARAAVESGAVSLVLLSFRLFGSLGGKDFLDELRAHCPRRWLPIIALLDKADNWHAASTLDFEDYLPDPFPLEDLIHLVDENCR